MLKSALAAFAACVSLVASASAAIATIDFDNRNFPIFNSYKEDGFAFTPASPGALSFWTGAGRLFDAQLNLGEQGVFSRQGGGLFAFQSFMYRSLNNNPADGFQLVGFRDGVQVADYGAFVSSSSVYVTQTTLNATLVDQLFLIGTGANRTTPFWDNFVFNTDGPQTEIPLPAAAPLFLAGLAAAAFARRKRKT